MANHFPTVPTGAHIAGLTYTLQIAQRTDSSGHANTSLALAEHGTQIYSIGFDTTIDATGNVAYDQTTFDQDAFEGELATMLDAWCAFTVAALGVTTAQAQAAVSVTRVWSVELDSEVLGSIVSQPVTDTMTYPAA